MAQRRTRPESGYGFSAFGVRVVFSTLIERRLFAAFIAVENSADAVIV
jgi:hypothetical protein